MTKAKTTNAARFLKSCLIFMLPAVFFYGCGIKKKYDIQIIFCDGRPPINKTVEQYSKPSSRDISTYKKAVPIYGGGCWCGENSEQYINVCDVKVVKEYGR